MKSKLSRSHVPFVLRQCQKYILRLDGEPRLWLSRILRRPQWNGITSWRAVMPKHMVKTKQVMSVAHRTAGGLRINRKWQKTAAVWKESISHRTEHTRLKEWALMCLTIIEDTSETFHSALGSSGRFLEGKRERPVIYQVAVLGVFYGGTGEHRSSTESQEQSAK